MALDAPLERASSNRDGTYILHAQGVDFHCDRVVNCAGLGAQACARMLQVPDRHIPPLYYAKGNYYRLQGVPNPFQHLVYPVPESAGLGVHATIDLGNQVRFGPDVEWVDDPQDFSVDPSRALAFYQNVRAYWPGLPDGALVPDYAGIRPKLQRPGEPPRDFLIQGPRDHGLPGLVSLFGIESPGLTSSLAIARLVCRVLELDG